MPMTISTPSIFSIGVTSTRGPRRDARSRYASASAAGIANVEHDTANIGFVRNAGHRGLQHDGIAECFGTRESGASSSAIRYSGAGTPKVAQQVVTIRFVEIGSLGEARPPAGDHFRIALGRRQTGRQTPARSRRSKA